MRTRIISGILILCMGFSIAGYYPMFKMIQLSVRKDIKHRIKSGIPLKDLQVITFNSSQKINWIRPGNEFLLEGQFYDVVRKEVSENILIYYCINDEQEKSLFASLDELVKNQLSDNESAEGQTALMLLKIFTEDFYLCELSVPLKQYPVEFSYTDFHIFLPDSFRRPEVPPPDLI